MNEIFLAIVVATITAGTPLVFGALGELVTEKSGVLNIGVEGMMLVGAICAVAVDATTGSLWLGVVAGMLAGALMALIHAILTLTLMANQVASGLALTLFGVGLSAYLGNGFVGVSLPAAAPVHIPILSDLPVLGQILFGYHALVYLSWALCLGVSWFLYRSHFGLVLRAVGESPTSAHSIGYPVIRIRYLATLFGGAMAGVGGAYLATVYTPMWTEGMTAGRGWIALALVVFATWRPERVLLGAYLFGGATIVQFFAQGSGIAVPTQLLSSLPYFATVLVLVIISRNAKTIRLNSPMSLGRSYRPE